MKTIFFTEVTASYFSVFLGLTLSPLGSFLIDEVYGVFFMLFLRGIKILSGVTLAKVSPCPEKTETLKLSP